MSLFICSKGKWPLVLVLFLLQLKVFGQITTCPTDKVPPVEDAVKNGDFERGEAGRNTFESDHQWAGEKIKANMANEFCNEGTVGHFFIGKEEEFFCHAADRRGTTFHQNFGNPFGAAMKDLPDHTLGKGYMLQVDSDQDHALAWQQEVDIFQDQEYFFSCWLANMIQGQYGQIAFFVKGELDNGNPTDPCYRLDATCADGATKPGFSAGGVMNWEQYTAKWQSGKNTKAIISIYNMNRAVNENDYAIDDISFINNCGQSTDPIPSLGPDLSICETDGELVLDTKIGQDAGRIFYWYDVTNNKFLEKGEDLDKYSVEEPGRYMVCVEDNSPCPKIDHIDILDTMSVKIDDVLMCEGDEKEVKSGIEKNSHLKFEWTGPSTNMGNGPDTKVNKNGKHTFKVTSSKYPNCIADDDFDVEQVLPEAKWEETDTLCPGQDVVIKGLGPDADEYTYWDAAFGGTEYLPGGKQITLQFDQFPVTVYVQNGFGCRIPIEIEENCPCDNPAPTVDSVVVCIGDTIKLNAEVASTDNPRFFWFGPNGFTSEEKSPTIPNASLNMAGDYFVYIKTDACNYPSDTVVLKVEVFEGEKVTIGEIKVNNTQLNENDTVDICISDPISILGTEPKNDETGIWEITDPNILTIAPLDNATPTIELLQKGITKITWTIGKVSDGLCPTIPTVRTIYINVLGLPGEIERIDGPLVVCERTEATYSIPKVDGATFYDWYLLPPGATGDSNSETITITFGNEGGKIGVRAGNICGIDTFEIKLDIILAPSAQIENDANICAGQVYEVKNASIENTMQYEWVLLKGNSANLTNTETLSPIYTSQPNEGGEVIILVLKALANAPCTIDASDTVHLLISEIPVFEVTNDTICEDEKTILTVTPQKDYPNVVYTWYQEPVDGTKISTGLTYETEKLKQDLQLWVEAEGSCEVPRIGTNVNVNPLPTALFSSSSKLITEKGEVIEFIDKSENGTKGQWYFGDGSKENYVLGNNPKHAYTPNIGEVPEAYLIKLILSTDYGCMDTATLKLPIDLKWAIFIPNAFTPNADGNNDNFFPAGYGIETYDMKIFNRWGEMLFHSTALENQWNGKNKGKELKSDVYVYKITVQNIYGKTFNYVGRVTLLK